MTIRRTLLAAFLMFSVIAAALMAVLAYTHSRNTLRNEIRLDLESQAMTVMQQVEAMLFERIKDVQSWRRLEVMQELRVGDVDKRLSRFLAGTAASYSGIYTALSCVRDGVVMASSDIQTIGRVAPVDTPWINVPMEDGALVIGRPASDTWDPLLTLHAPLVDAFAHQPLGHVRADVDWTEAWRLLDKAVGRTPRLAVLVDQDGRTLAASSALRKLPAISQVLFSDWVPAGEPHGPFAPGGQRLARGRLVGGFARSAGYKDLPALGWTLMILTPEQAAFEPIAQLLWTLLALLAGIVLVAVMLAIGISGRIARPIQALTALAHDITQTRDTPPALIGGSREIEQLSTAFNRMIGDLKTSQERLVRASKLATVGEMAATLSHELRTPLGIIRSSAQLIMRQQNLDQSGRELLDYMLNECDRINGLITSLLETARPRTPICQPHDLHGIIRHVIEMLATKADDKGVTVAFEAGPGDAIVECDRDQMIQVLINLVMNAIQMVAGRGRVLIRTWRNDTEFCLEIDDDGPGVPEDRKEHIMEPFVSHRQGGIGLGLSVVQEIVQKHQATITVGRSPIGGASFLIRLPLAAKADH